MAHEHSHGIATAKLGPDHARRLRLALALTATFLIAELIAAWLTAASHYSPTQRTCSPTWRRLPSRSPLSESDNGRRIRNDLRLLPPRDLAAAANAIMLFAVAIYIGWEAWQRFRIPAEVQSMLMLIVAAVGLAVNLVAMKLLRARERAESQRQGAPISKS